MMSPICIFGPRSRRCLPVSDAKGTAPWSATYAGIEFPPENLGQISTMSATQLTAPWVAGPPLRSAGNPGASAAPPDMVGAFPTPTDVEQSTGVLVKGGPGSRSGYGRRRPHMTTLHNSPVEFLIDRANRAADHTRLAESPSASSPPGYPDPASQSACSSPVHPSWFQAKPLSLDEGKDIQLHPASLQCRVILPHIPMPTRTSSADMKLTNLDCISQMTGGPTVPINKTWIASRALVSGFFGCGQAEPGELLLIFLGSRSLPGRSPGFPSNPKGKS